MIKHENASPFGLRLSCLHVLYQVLRCLSSGSPVHTVRWCKAREPYHLLMSELSPKYQATLWVHKRTCRRTREERRVVPRRSQDSRRASRKHEETSGSPDDIPSDNEPFELAQRPLYTIIQLLCNKRDFCDLNYTIIIMFCPVYSKLRCVARGALFGGLPLVSSCFLASR